MSRYKGVRGYPPSAGAIKDVARRFAVYGYVAIAPALFSREAFLACVDEEDVAKGLEWTQRRPDAQTIGDLAGALTFLRDQPFVNEKLGLIGFCSGGRAALVFACSSTALTAFVNGYSNNIIRTNEVNPVPAIDRVKDLSCPMLGLFGADDPNPSPADVQRLRQALATHGKPFEIVTYKNAAHAFFSDTRQSYRPEACQMAWGRMLEWLSRYLKP
jgi:carboxymethylenebutenolidase